ncbi:Nociceptin receptor [Varanus komodoensis]|nr:Nociceptin receptor [Varanus komodoensis]
MDPFFHTQAGDLLYMRKLVNDSSLWNLSLGDWFHNRTTDSFLPVGIKVTIVFVYSIVCIIGLVGNCSVMYVIIRNKFLEESDPDCSLEGQSLKMKLKYFGH